MAQDEKWSFPVALVRDIVALSLFSHFFSPPHSHQKCTHLWRTISVNISAMLLNEIPALIKDSGADSAVLLQQQSGEMAQR